MNFFSLFKRNLIYKFKKKTNIDEDNFENKDLDELLYYYGSDKANIFKKNEEKGHGFSKYYSNFFSRFEKSNLNILEIGYYAGASAAAFSKYLSNSTVCCFDINISNFAYSSKNIHVFGLDIKNEKKVKETLLKLKKEFKIDTFDVIIDDGSHNLSDILFSIKILFKNLRKKGLYVIEDYKYPNYYDYNNDMNHIFVDKILENLKEKKHFESKILTTNIQNDLFTQIKQIFIYKGNLKDSDICFIEKK